MNGTPDNDAITYGPGVVDSSDDAMITVDKLESIEFSNKSAVTINTGSGTDTVTYDEGVTETGMAAGVAINADNVTSTLVYNAAAVGYQITVTPEINFSGTIDSGSDLMSYSNIAKVSIVGNNVTGIPLDIEPSDSQSPFGEYVVSAGITNGSGTITGTSLNGSSAIFLSTISYSGIDAYSGVIFGAITPLGSLNGGLDGSSVTYNPLAGDTVDVNGNVLTEVLAGDADLLNSITINTSTPDDTYLVINPTSSTQTEIVGNTLAVQVVGTGPGSGCYPGLR